MERHGPHRIWDESTKTPHSTPQTLHHLQDFHTKKLVGITVSYAMLDLTKNGFLKNKLCAHELIPKVIIIYNGRKIFQKK